VDALGGAQELLEYSRRFGLLAGDLADHPAKVGAQFARAGPRPVVEPGIGREAHRLGLHRRIDIHPLELRGLDHFHPQSGLDRFLQHRFCSRFAQPLTPPGHARWIDRHLVLEKLFAAEVLPVGILDPVLDHGLVAEVVLIFEIVQRHQQTRVHPRRAIRGGVGRPQSLREPRPVHLPAKLHQRMLRIHQLLQFYTEKFTLGLSDLWFWLHRFSRI